MTINCTLLVLLLKGVLVLSKDIEKKNCILEIIHYKMLNSCKELCIYE